MILPEEVDKERRKEILSEGIIEIWQQEEERKAKEAKEAKEAKKTAKDPLKKARSSKGDSG